MKTIINTILKEAKWIGKIAIDFATKEEYDKYMKAHPDADPKHHKVVEKKEEPPSDIKEEKKNLEEKIKSKEKKIKKSPDSLKNYSPIINKIKDKDIKDAFREWKMQIENSNPSIDDSDFSMVEEKGVALVRALGDAMDNDKIDQETYDMLSLSVSTVGHNEWNKKEVQ